MVFVVLRFLLLIVIIGIALYYFKVKSYKVKTKEERRQKLEEAKFDIEQTLADSKNLPDVCKKKLEAAKGHIDEFLKLGKKAKI